jgi:hypothetical protein
VAITSKGVPLRRGDLVRYQLWLRAGDSDASRGSQVQLFDSLGGRDLAIHIAPTATWTPVAFYRFATADGDAALTVALLGSGAVDLDSIEIQTLSQEQISAKPSAGK